MKLSYYPRRIMALLCPIIACTVPALMAADNIWNAGASSQDWNQGSNWSLNRAPNATDGVRITDSTADIIITGTDTEVGSLYNQSGKLTMDESQIKITGNGDLITVGQLANETAELVIKDGAELLYAPTDNTLASEIYIGLGAGTSGRVTVESGGKLTMTGRGEYTSGSKKFRGRLQVGATGTGYLDIKQGGLVSVGQSTVGNGGDGVGYVTVEGRFEIAGKFHLGNNAGGTGNVTIKEGGYLYTGGGTYMGNKATTEGTMTIETGGKWESNSWIAVGENGKGTFNLQEGAEYVGTYNFGHIYIGHLEGGEGTVNVNGGSIDNKGYIYVGMGQDASGAVNLTRGSVKGTTTYIASGKGTQGKVEMSGGTWEATTTTIASGTNSTALLDISGGKWTSPSITIASVGTGTVLVSGNAEIIADTITFGYSYSTGKNAVGLLQLNSHTTKLMATDSTSYTEIKGNAYGVGTIRFNHTGEMDFQNVVGGANVKVEHSNTGTTIMGGDNSYALGTDLYAGVIRVMTSTALGTGTVSFEETAVVQFGEDDLDLANEINIEADKSGVVDTREYSGTLSGKITGDGVLYKKGAGTVILTGADNDYAGGTYVSEGIVQITEDMALGTGDAQFLDNTTLSLAGDLTVANNMLLDTDATVTFDSGTYTSILTGEVTGGGTLKKTGTGEITFTSEILLPGGGIYVQEGALVLANTADLGTVDIMDGAVLTVQDQTDIITLNMEGASAFNVDGDTEVVSLTTIEEDATVTIAQDKTLILGGGADLYADIYGPGTLQIEGQATIRSVEGDVYNNGEITTRGTNLEWGGTLTNNGVINFMGLDSFVTAGNLAGTDGVQTMEINMETGETAHLRITGDATGEFRLVMTDVSANPNLMVPDKYQPVIVRIEGDTDAVYTGSFDAGIWNYEIISIAGPNGATDWVPYLTSEYSPTGNAILNMTGAMSTAWFSQLDNLHKRMGELRLGGVGSGNTQDVCRGMKDGQIWVRTYGQQVNTDLGIRGLSGFREYQYGGDIGVDGACMRDRDNLVMTGFFGGYMRGERMFKDGSGSRGNTDSFYGGLYGTWLNKEGWYADLVVKGQRYDQSYKIRGGAWERAHYLTWGLGASLEFGRQFSLKDDWFVEPSVQFAYLRINGKDFTTSDNVQVDYSNANVYQFAATVRGGRTYRQANGNIWQPYAKIGVVEQVSSGGRVDTAGRSWRPNTDGLRGFIGTGVMWQLSQKDQIHLDYEASISEKVTIPWNVNLGYRRSF